MAYTPFVAPSNQNGGWGLNGATVQAALNTNDDGTTEIRYHNSANAANEVTYVGLTTPVPSNLTSIKINLRVMCLGPPTTGNTIRFGIYRPADGFTYFTTTYQQAALGPVSGVWNDFTATIDLTTGGENIGSGDFKLMATSNGFDSYFLVSYGTVVDSTFTITSSAGAHGSISPSGDTPVSPGGSQAYTITPDSGYTIADVLVDSVSVGAVSSYTFTNVQAAHTISATFISSITPVTTAIGSGAGTISRSPSGAVVAGTSVTFTATPGSASHFVSWGGDVVSTDNPLVVVVNSPISLTANFQRNISGATAYDFGSIVGQGANVEYDARQDATDRGNKVTPHMGHINTSRTFEADDWRRR